MKFRSAGSACMNVPDASKTTGTLLYNYNKVLQVRKVCRAGKPFFLFIFIGMMKAKFLFITAIMSLSGCYTLKLNAQPALNNFLKTNVLVNAHVGVSVYEPASGKFLYDYQGDKYFVPASNVKIATCYAAMKYLGDSLEGLRYQFKNDTLLLIQPTADPTFLHPAFPRQNVYEFLNKASQVSIQMVNPNWQAQPLGKGWSWDDYNDSYMAERSSFPLYGNLARFFYNGNGYTSIPSSFHVRMHDMEHGSSPLFIKGNHYEMIRGRNENDFVLMPSSKAAYKFEIPFVANSITQKNLLEDTLHRSIATNYSIQLPKDAAVIYSYPTDSLLMPMMHESDNFFAEQSLLMVSNRLSGNLNDEAVIDHILKIDYKDLPQKPRWVDASGLSRYNLFSPQDFVSILNRMQNEFGMERIKEIFPSGNEGTLKHYYAAFSKYIYAKTGTLSGIVAISGFLYTRKNNLLIFSLMVNNHNGSASEIRRAMENFITSLYQQE